jgi:hypothetical protein
MDHIELARLGGKARWKDVTPADRSEAARNLVNARWGKRKNEAVAVPKSRKRRGRKKAA